MSEFRKISVAVNGTRHETEVEVRRSLVDFLREDLRLVGAHIGCENGVCGACTVLMNGASIRSCIVLAVQADDAEIMTVEDLAANGHMHPLQEAFSEKQGLQCGYCTPGMLMRAYELLGENPDPTAEQVRRGMSNNLCRCTGYQYIVEAVLSAAARPKATVPEGDRPYDLVPQPRPEGGPIEEGRPFDPAEDSAGPARPGPEKG